VKRFAGEKGVKEGDDGRRGQESGERGTKFGKGERIKKEFTHRLKPSLMGAGI